MKHYTKIKSSKFNGSTIIFAPIIRHANFSFKIGLLRTDLCPQQRSIYAYKFIHQPL